ncbi:hypothetical protein [Methylocystis echinoides]|uniref:hypothetical protein n=1 Tax=Methylocystis echinoides TaxID=29468 RepID=UPI003418F244
MRPSAALLLLSFAATPACGFEWDDGRGAFPFRPATTRRYEAAPDRDATVRARRSAQRDGLYVISSTRPAPPLILRSTVSGLRAQPARRPEAIETLEFH